MGSGSSNQVRSGIQDDKVENIDIRSTSTFNGSGTKEKIRPSSSSSLMNRKSPKSKNNNEAKKSTEKNFPGLKSKSTHIVDEDISDTTEYNKKTLTPVHAANISQLSPSESTNIRNYPSVENLSQANQMEKLKQIELQLAKSESQRLDAMDQLQILEEKLKSHELQRSSQMDNEMSETIHAKDQLIWKLEKDLKTSEAEAKTTRLKLKRRIKTLTSRLQEVRQELSIGQMELKGEISQLKENLRSSDTPGNNAMSKASPFNSSPTSQSKLIVELSNQMTEQSERIKVLENQLIERDAQILSLQSLHSKTESGKNESGQNSVSGDRLRSSRGSRNHRSTAKLNDNNPQEFPLLTNGIGSSDHRPSYSRQSTALSDSDSEWDRNDVRPQTLSAPARTRVENSVLKKPVARDGGVPCDDDSLLEYLGTDTSVNRAGTTHSSKKSALRKHLEKKKNENQTNSLMGPSLAFSPPGQDPPNDTLSNEPTPRYQDNPARLPGFSKLTIVQTVQN